MSSCSGGTEQGPRLRKQSRRNCDDLGGNDKTKHGSDCLGTTAKLTTGVMVPPPKLTNGVAVLVGVAEAKLTRKNHILGFDVMGECGSREN